MIDSSKFKQFQSQIDGIEDELYEYACKLAGNKYSAKDLLREAIHELLNSNILYNDKESLKSITIYAMRNIYLRNIVDLDNHLFWYMEIKRIPTMKEIVGSLKELELEYKVPLAMHLSGYKNKEIAKRMCISPEEVLMKLAISKHRIKKRLNASMH